MHIESIKSPAELKQLGAEQLPALAAEMRQALITKLSTTGGHIGPNLGMVEATIALHRVFETPLDRFVFDVSHQSYCHKILTGRAQAFLEPAHYGDVTGYSNHEESPHDNFIIGHTSTAISLALGLCKGRDVCGGSENVVAIIGDGSLSGGEALEGLCCAGEYDGKFIIVVNDNQMSIAENHGGIYKNLELLRQTNGTAELNWFRAQGLDYIYVADGNNIAQLVEAFERAKNCTRPVVVHINTLKGKGLAFAEANKERYHYGGPFNIADGSSKSSGSGESWGDITGEYLLQKAAVKPELVAMVAGVPGALGLNQKRRAQLGRQYVDSGIAEEHSVAMASGIARRGGSPVFGTFATFFQRTYDQLSQDVAINKTAATFVVAGASMYGMNDVTHLCIYDIPMISNIPGLVYLAPTCAEEYLAMLDWAIEQNALPVAIRVPDGKVLHRQAAFDTDYSQLNKFKIEHRGKQVALIGVGKFYERAEQIAALLKEKNIEATLINPRFVSGIDEQLLNDLQTEHSLVVSLEDGIIDGGFGEKIARHYSTTPMRVLVRGIRKDFYDRFNADELSHQNRLDAAQVAEDVMGVLS